MKTQTTEPEDRFRTFQSKDDVLQSAGQQLRFYENLFKERGEEGHAYAASFFAKACEHWGAK